MSLKDRLQGERWDTENPEKARRRKGRQGHPGSAFSKKEEVFVDEMVTPSLSKQQLADYYEELFGEMLRSNPWGNP